jgi:hypothetical protein
MFKDMTCLPNTRENFFECFISCVMVFEPLRKFYILKWGEDRFNGKYEITLFFVFGGWNYKSSNGITILH